MKLMGFFISASLVLNAYVLWRLQEHSSATPEALGNFAVSSSTQRPNASGGTDDEQEETISFLKKQITQLNLRLQSLEQSYDTLATSENDIAPTPEQYSQEPGLVDFIQPEKNAGADEEWFWSQQSTDNDISLSFSPIEGLAVNSVVCRSDWCRVEIEDTSGETNDLISGLELQLKIDKSLGRNTTIQSGEKNGQYRVLFIQ